MYDTLSIEVGQNDLPPQDVSQPKYFPTSLLNEHCHLLAQNVSSLHDVKICLHSLCYISNESRILIVVHVKPVKIYRYSSKVMILLLMLMCF